MSRDKPSVQVEATLFRGLYNLVLRDTVCRELCLSSCFLDELAKEFRVHERTIDLIQSFQTPCLLEYHC